LKQSWRQALASRDGLNAGWQIVVFLLVMIALFSRCPSRLTQAQFYAEDGTYWFAQAYNSGWLHSLTLPDGGYLNTLQRLGAGVALLFPLRWAPLVTVLIGMSLQALPVTILLSSRCRNWGPLPLRLVYAAVYVAIPNSREIHVVLTNSQWHLALAEALLAFAASPLIWRGQLLDGLFFLLAGFCGPFGIVLAPLVLLFWWLRRQNWSLVIFCLLSAGAITQIWVLLHSVHRTQYPLGANFGALVRMVGGNIVAGALFGSHAFSTKAPMIAIVASALVGLGIVLYRLRFANLEWRLWVLYCVALLAASLRSPLIPGSKPLWDLLVIEVAARYWFFSMLVFLWSAVWCALYARDRVLKIAGACLCFAMLIGIGSDWRYGDFPDDHFAASVARVREAKPGEHVIVPIPPKGWSMELVKKPGADSQ
jgi:hypothetical protein